MKYYIILLVILLFIYSFHITKEHFELTKYTKPIIDQKAASAKAVETWRKIANNQKK